MKKLSCHFILILFSLFGNTSSAREFTGKEADEQIKGSEKVITGSRSSIPEFILFRKETGIDYNKFSSWAHEAFKLSAEYDFKLINASKDKIGMIHYRYQQTFTGSPVEGTMFIVHTRNNVIESVNGVLFDRLDAVRTALLSESIALTTALVYMNAEKYRWEIPQMEKQLKQATGNPDATWFPKGELMLAADHGKMKNENFRLAYRFDVYSEKPLKREYVFVDAQTGSVLYSVNRIHTANTQATAHTKYSGIRLITTDSVNASSFRLRETGRGLGIETYNCLTTVNQASAVDFNDADNNWQNINAQQDEVATDAHWGAEITYDFYQTKFGRNSVDNAGQKLLSYVHFSSNYLNANWDGTEMNYGDGDLTQGYSPLTCLDVTGHEISHGVTEFTSNLGNATEPEAGALNEGFSDCMGNSIRQYGKNNAVINWLIGDEMGGTPFRSMSNPNLYGCPDTYRGQFWDFVNQEVHQNGTVLGHWFYLLTMGGTGTNDNGDTYNVTGLGIDVAAAICYRMNTVYLFPDAGYDDARTYSIRAAIDLYGSCSNEVAQVTNAWRAVGLGNAYVAGVHSDFFSHTTLFCRPPASMQFQNASANGITYTWNFGDGSLPDNAENPVHTFINYGHYTVKLIADGGSCGVDTMTKVQYISVDSLNPCVFLLPNSGTGTVLTDCEGQLFDNGGTAGNYFDNTNTITTIAPPFAAHVTLTFSFFAMEHSYDYLYIYDGPDTNSLLIGKYTGYTLPNGGTITSSNGFITIRQTSDQALNYEGFGLLWQCSIATAPPTADFVFDNNNYCDGTVKFTDQTVDGVTSWHWNFGDGDTSDLQSPLHIYNASGTYPVVLTASNAIGTDSSLFYNVTVNLAVAPVITSNPICEGTSATLVASGLPIVAWFDSTVAGNLIHTGNVFSTPVLLSNKTYYAEMDLYPGSQHVGPVDNSFGNGVNFTNSAYRAQLFDALSPLRLVSVKVFAVGTNNRTITLIQNAVTLQTVTVNIPAGTSRVTLNWDIPAGTNYELGATGPTNLFRNAGATDYPYILNGLVSINGNVAGQSGNYYFFYDWEVQRPVCRSTRSSAAVNVLPSPVAAYSSSIIADSVQFINLSSGATSWLWNFDDPFSGSNNLSTAINPNHLFTTEGTHNVCLYVNIDSTCHDSICQSVLISGISSNPLSNSSITIYPNPVSDQLTIQFENGFEGKKCELRLIDILGQIVAEKTISIVRKNENNAWDFSSIAPGAYTIEITGENRKVMKSIIRE